MPEPMTSDFHKAVVGRAHVVCVVMVGAHGGGLDQVGVGLGRAVAGPVVHADVLDVRSVLDGVDGALHDVGVVDGEDLFAGSATHRGGRLGAVGVVKVAQCHRREGSHGVSETQNSVMLEHT